MGLQWRTGAVAIPMIEPSLSSDTRSMLHDEVWHVIAAQRDHLVDLEARVQVIEGDKPHGPWHDLMVRVKALEDYLDHDVIDEVAPLPREDLD